MRGGCGQSEAFAHGSVLPQSIHSCRNWHWDEPSCGFEVCVVMYHQPSASAGEQGGLYMFQWNDDNCETKNNFICKYTAGTAVLQYMYKFMFYYTNSVDCDFHGPQRGLRSLPLSPTSLNQVKYARYEKPPNLVGVWFPSHAPFFTDEFPSSVQPVNPVDRIQDRSTG